MTSKTIYSTPMCSCIICKKEYSIKGIHTHFIREHGTTDQKSKYKSGFTVSDRQSKFDKTSERINQEIGIYNGNPNFCQCCNKVLDYKSRNSKYCSQSCSAKSTNKKRKTPSDNLKNNISDGVKNFHKKLKLDFIGPPKPEPRNICKGCNSEFFGFNKFCSKICRKAQTNKNLSEKQIYRNATAFKFSVYDYPEEFDLNLIQLYGWYSASNRGNNLNGISRDHMVSVSYGFKNNISAEIISHPANCKLLRHRDNFAKKDKCTITIDELISRIVTWNTKYQNTLLQAEASNLA